MLVISLQIVVIIMNQYNTWDLNTWLTVKVRKNQRAEKNVVQCGFTLELQTV